MQCCEEVEYDQYVANVQKAELKLQVDEWVIKYNNWLTKTAVASQKRGRLPQGAWQDIKSELILQAYECSTRFDPSRGVPLKVFIISTLWNYGLRNDIRNRYSESKASKIELDRLPQSPREISSLERSHDVFSKLTVLQPGEQMLIRLRFEQGFTPGQIDELMETSRGTTWHRIKSILLKLQSVCRAEG